MSFFKAYRQERARHSAPESVATLYYMEDFFLDGKNWVKGVYRGAGNTRCMVGAAEHVRTSSIDDAKHWLRRAIIEHTGGAVATIEEYNDTQDSFEGVKAVLNRARQLATANLPALDAPIAPHRAVEIIPPGRDDTTQRNPRAFDDAGEEHHQTLHEAWVTEETPKHKRDSSLWQKMGDWID
jgi:hypothetical protein